VKDFLIVLAVLIAAVVVYELYVGRTFEPPQGPRPKGTAERVLDSGRDVGRSTSKALQSINFGGKK